MKVQKSRILYPYFKKFSKSPKKNKAFLHIKYRTKNNVAKIVASGNTLLKEFPELRESLWKGQLWNGSYFCETIGSVSEENILKYIERQKNCQL